MIGGENGILCKSQLTGSLSRYLEENNYDLPHFSEILCNIEWRIYCHEKHLQVELHACILLPVHEWSVPSLYLLSFTYCLFTSISLTLLQY
jgi:hypothetical protein